ncbi:MAG: hypothetical protein FWC58_07330 [Desulfobulbus sp.]|nr:hypothetical protein [Desulfobulbus sp.]
MKGDAKQFLGHRGTAIEGWSFPHAFLLRQAQQGGASASAAPEQLAQCTTLIAPLALALAECAALRKGRRPSSDEDEDTDMDPIAIPSQALRHQEGER